MSGVSFEWGFLLEMNLCCKVGVLLSIHKVWVFSLSLNHLLHMKKSLIFHSLKDWRKSPPTLCLTFQTEECVLLFIFMKWRESREQVGGTAALWAGGLDDNAKLVVLPVITSGRRRFEPRLYVNSLRDVFEPRISMQIAGEELQIRKLSIVRARLLKNWRITEIYRPSTKQYRHASRVNMRIQPAPSSSTCLFLLLFLLRQEVLMESKQHRCRLWSRDGEMKGVLTSPPSITSSLSPSDSLSSPLITPSISLSDRKSASCFSPKQHSVAPPLITPTRENAFIGRVQRLVGFVSQRESGRGSLM